MSEARHVGFIGIGAMGNPMAANLLAAGHRLTVTDLRADSAANLIADGAAWADTPAAVAAASDVTFLSLPAPADVEDVVTRADGVLAGAQPGTAIIDVSTNDPDVARALASAAAERDVGYLDAPVSGGVSAARRGKLAVMVGGETACFERHRALFDVVGDRVFHVGSVGAGNVVKLVNNMLFFVNLLGTVEALVLGAKAGVDPSTLSHVVQAGSGGSFAWSHATHAILDDRLTPTFTVGLATKDVDLAAALAASTDVDIPMGALAQELLRRHRDDGFQKEDVLSLVRTVEEHARFIVRGIGRDETAL